MQFIITNSFSALVNEILGETFSLEREVRQEDHISPYILLFVSSILVDFMTSSKSGIGNKVSSNSPIIPHLMFADKNMIFCEGNKKAARTVEDILVNYCISQFSKIYSPFLKRTKNRKTHDIVDILKVPFPSSIGTYLGCQNVDYKRTRRYFKKIKERISSKLASWKAKVIS